MPIALAEIGTELVETALTFAPWLEEVPVLGRILRIIAPGGGNDIKALEQYQAELVKKDTDRKTRIAKNARYVLKASDAMQCVQNSLGNGGVLLSVGKGLINVLAGRQGGTSPDLLMDAIFSCIESKVLKQTSRRTLGDRLKVYHRPSKGHGHGRTKSTVAPQIPPEAPPAPKAKRK